MYKYWNIYINNNLEKLISKQPIFHLSENNLITDVGSKEETLRMTVL